MQTIGLVVAFSEKCQPLLEHFILTLEKNVIPFITNRINIELHIYQCNFVIIDKERYHTHRHSREILKSTFAYKSFESKLSLQHLKSKLKIHIHDCSDTEFGHHDFYLPDIAVYQDFCDKYSKQYDYLMFCHDDIAFYNPTDMIDKMLLILNTTAHDIIANCSANFNNDLSVRFHPAMIFIKRTAFEINNLSFINSLALFDHNSFRIFTDGGAGLLASYYRKDIKNANKKPYSILPSTWFTHIRAMGDTGVEFCYQYYDEISEFKRVMDYVQLYNDDLLYNVP